MSTLSVDTSAMGWPSATVSPGFTNQLRTVASSIVADNAGSRISSELMISNNSLAASTTSST